jgi:hypothetical protein
MELAEAVRLKSRGTAMITKTEDKSWVRPPAELPVMVIGYDPAGVSMLV